MVILGILGILALISFSNFLYTLWKNDQEKQKGISTNDANKHLYDQAVEQMQEDKKQIGQRNGKA